MSKRDFDAAVKRLTIAERGIEMARRVLVGGQSQSVVAAEFKVTLGAVSHQVGRVWKAFIDAQDIPPGHVRVSAVLPADKAEIVKSWEKSTEVTPRRSR